MAEGTVKLRALGSGTGAPIDGTGAQAASLMRYTDMVVDVTSTGIIQSYAPTGFGASSTGIRISPPGDVTLRGMSLAAGQEIFIRVGRGSTTTVTINHEDASAAAVGERFNCPRNVPVTITGGESVLIRNNESRNNIIAVGRQVSPGALSPVASNVAVTFNVYVPCPSGGTAGTADDVTIWNANAPFGLRILDAQLRVSTAVGGSSAALRTASGGGGSVVLPDPAASTQTFSTAATGVLEDLATATATVASGGSLFLRRSDRSVVGELVLQCIRT